MTANPPRATYRIQFHAGFTFADATAVVPYLARLGISHLYSSPLFAARPGSTHGYDVIDPTRLNPELGTNADFDRLVSALHAQSMGMVLDIVPNHMAASELNPWWRDILANGRDSQYARFFDIAWDEEAGRIVLPTLGVPLEQTIAEGHVAREGDALRVYDRRLPLAPGTPDGSLDQVLAYQHYRLAYWRDTLPNYRRFFEISDLVGMRVEDPDVFEATHAFVLRLLSEGKIDGLRIDHVDGLRDPLAYLRRLRQRAHEATGSEPYIVVEKILGENEALPDGWPVDGTTGYDYLGEANALFADGQGLRHLTTTYRKLTGTVAPLDEVLYQRKRTILATRFERELRWLSQSFARLAGIDEPLAHEAVLQLSSCLPVYRTYITQDRLSEADAGYLTIAVDGAIEAGADPKLIDRLRETILNAAGNPEALEFTLRWQQLTGPAMAKGLEDSTFYRYNRLISLNEVGGHGEALNPIAFHRFVRNRARRWPHAINATSTHDTKRSEDVRARLAGIAEEPRVWAAAIGELFQTTRDSGAPEIDANTRYHLFQAAVGCWPLSQDQSGNAAQAFPERLAAYALKAVREAAEHTSWIDNDQPYEQAVQDFVAWLTTHRNGAPARSRIERLVRRLDQSTFKRSLAQLVLKLTLPGVPDIYQGQELWDWSFVDPDNRRPVDYDLRARLLDDLGQERAALRDLLRTPAHGSAKLFVTHRLLQLRRELPGLFAHAGYRPLAQRDRSLVAFARHHRGQWLITVVPRLFTTDPEYLNIPLPSGAPRLWTGVLDGGTLRVRDGALPVAKALRSGFPLVAVAA